MSTCVNININSKEWKALTAEIGQFEAVRDFMEYNRIRTVNEVRSDKPQLLKGKLDGSKVSQEIEGKLEANKDRLIELLGSSMYSEKLKDVVYKELLQNAFDATKIAESKGLIDKGKIDIEIDEKDRVISFTDNGIGMTPEIVQKAFFTIGGTYKGEDVDNKLKSGGLGLAKMAFIFGSEKLSLETIHNGIKTTVDATSEEIRKDNFKIKTEPTNQKNGTKVSVKIPEAYVDSKGESRRIDFPKYSDSEFKYSFLANPLIGNVDINYSIVNRTSSYNKEEQIKTNLGNIPEGFVLFSPAKTSFADMDIYIDTKNITRGSYSDTEHKILSSGLFQFDVGFETDDRETIPLNIIINIKPKVDPTNAQYPFNNQRENFKPTVKNDIGALNKYLALLWHSIEVELLKSSFNKIKNIEAVSVENVDDSIINKNKEITKSFTSLSNSEIIKGVVDDFNKKNQEAIITDGGLKTKELSLTKDDIDKDKEKGYKRTFKAEKEISVDKDTGLNLDSNKPIIHNNTDMVLDEKSTKFLSEISSIMIEYKKSIIDFYGENYSSNIKNQLWGVSIDKTYGGINVNPSFLNMLAVNPFYNFPDNPNVDAVNYIAVAVDHLIIHELNHNFVRNEGAEFTGRFLQTYSEIHSLPNHFELVSKLKLSIKNNLETIKKLNYEYEQSKNVESGFEGNKLERDNKKRADTRTKTLSNIDTTINDRADKYDTRSSEKFGEIIAAKQTTSTDPMFYRELPIESTEEFFANYVPEMNEQEQKNARANEIVNKLVERLRNALGIEASVITSDEARAMLAAYGHGYNNEPGFFFDGKVYLVGDKVTTETVFHEFAHPLLKAIRATNPTLFTNLYKRLEQTAEGKAIIEGVRAAYPDKVFGSPEFMEEVLAHALGKKADNINRSVPESTGFTKFIKDLLYAIKQLFRSVFKGNKIRIENLDVNTTLDELANMLVNESFVINTDVIKESAPEFIRNLNNEFVKEVAQIEQKRLRLISKALFSMSKKQRRLLDYTNYRETRNILKDEMGRSDFSEIISALYTYQTEGTQAFSTPEEEEAFLNSHAIALLNSILRLETGAERVLKHFKTIVDKIEDDSITPEEKQKALLSAFYLNRVIKDWREFIEEAKTQLRAANVPSNHEIFGILNNVTEKLDRTKTLSDKIYTEGVGEMLTDQLTTLMDNINKHYETILNNYRSRGASPEIIKLYEDEFDAVKLTPEKIKQYLLGELGDAHALNVFLEGFAHAQDPIIMGFAGYVKDRFVAMSSKIHENYYNFINDIEDLVNKAGYTSAYSRMTMGKDMLYLDIVERDENGLPTKTVWKYLTPFKDYKGKYRQLKLEKDKLKKLVETENTDEVKQKYVLAIAALESFEKAYMNRKYTDAFYEKERFFQDEIGLEALRRRDAILDIIRSIKSGIQNPDDIIKNTELTKRYWREYKQLSSLYNLDGTPKDPDSMEYKVAQRLQEYKNFVKKFYDVVPLSGVFENAYLNFIRNLKLQGLSPDEMSIKIEEWTKLNTVKKLSSEFYEERGEVLLKLRQLSAGDPNQLRITEIFDEINRLLSMYKDDNGHPEGSSIPLSVAERIKALEDEFQDLKSDDYFDFKGTEKIVRENYISNFSDYQKYLAGDTSVWADKSDDEILDLVNFMAYAENALMSPIVNRLISEFSATNGRDPSASELTDIQTKALSILNSAIEKRALLAKLMDLSKREMTEDYVDMINNFIDASPEAIEFLKEATNRPDEGFNIDTVKSIFLSTVLPKLKEINPSITFTDISGNSSTITFSEWFDNNHIVNVYQSDTGEEQIKYTPTRLWTYTAPKEDRYYETTKFNDPETGEEIEIIGVPSLEYTTRIVKDSYVDDNGNTILLKTPRISMLDCIRQGIGIENATIDMHGDWLPKYNVPNSPYVNSDFAQLRATSPDKYNLLMALLKKHLEIQEELPYDSRLDLEYERYRASQYEVVTSRSEAEGGGNPISRYFRNLRQYFAKTADNYEHGLNMEEREMFVKADLFDDEYAKVPITGLYFIDPNLVSMDMITSISRYMQSAIKQRTLIDMLPMARVLQKITVENPPYEVKESVINSFKKGRLANRIASSIATPFGAKGNNFRAAALNAFIEREFEGKNVSGWGSDTVSNFANSLLSLSSKTFFSFNLPSALKNSMGARWQSLIQAAAGNNFNSKDYALGTLWANKVTSEITLQIHKFGKKSLNYLLVELMDPTQERLSSGIREGKGISKSVGKDAFEFKYATNVREWTQLNASLSIFGAMLNKTLVDYTAPNGTVTKIKYSDAWEVVNGKLQLKQGVDQTYAPGGKNYVKFVKNLHGVTNKINGAYDSFNQPLAARYLLYRMIMHLKKYFMELFMERFKFRYSAKHGMIVPRYDGYTDSIGMGYYVEFLRAAKRFFGVYKMNFHNMTDTERQASKKVMMEGGLLLLFNLVLLGLLFGWDDDDEEKYAKLRAKSDALPLPFVTDNPDRDFKLNGWFSNHLLNLTMQIEAENDSWIPVPGLGLNDYADIFQLNSVALSSTIGSYTNLINQLYQMADYAVTGDTDALYKRTAGPYDWQTEGKFKFWNHLGKILTFTGTSVEPIKSIENLQRRENL